MDATPDPPALEGHESVDELVDVLRARVAERTAKGLYPADLETDLDHHFSRIVAHRPAPYDDAELRQKLQEMEAAAAAFDPGAIRYDSGVPGGPALHRAIGKTVSRQTAGVLAQVQRFATSVQAVVRELVVAIEHPNAHVHAELLGQVDNLMERMVGFDRAPHVGEGGLGDLQRRIEQLESAEKSRRVSPSYSNERFEAAFRGSREELLERYRGLAGSFAGCGVVVDLGSGRGEFLELLAEMGVEATGVEIDPALVASSRAAGLDVVQADAVEWLSACDDARLGGVSMIQVIEHLAPASRIEVIDVAARKLRRGGRIVIETLNPQSLYVFARAFYVDPTHDRPVHPAFLDFLLKEAGFSDVSIQWRSLPPEAERLDTTGADEMAAANLERINQILFAPQDFAIVATR